MARENWMKAIRDLPCALREIRDAVREVQSTQQDTLRSLRTLVAKEAHDEEVLAAIQAALGGVDLPPGKIEAINTIIQANLAKLRGVIASAPPAKS